IEKNNIILKTNKVDLYYGQIQALNEVSMEIKKGQIVALLGPNGSGKSSLLKAISGLYPPNRGKVYFDGKNITNIKTWKLARQGVLLMPEGRGLLREMTVDENLDLTPLE